LKGYSTHVASFVEHFPSALLSYPSQFFNTEHQ
jgi:hypothetical protein